MCQEGYVQASDECPLCGESRESELTSLEDENIECGTCGLIFGLDNSGIHIEDPEEEALRIFALIFRVGHMVDWPAEIEKAAALAAY